MVKMKTHNLWGMEESLCAVVYCNHTEHTILTLAAHGNGKPQRDVPLYTLHTILILAAHGNGKPQRDVPLYTIYTILTLADHGNGKPQRDVPLHTLHTILTLAAHGNGNPQPTAWCPPAWIHSIQKEKPLVPKEMETMKRYMIPYA